MRALSEQSSQSWAGTAGALKISMESANDCKIYSTRHTSMRRFREWRRTENTRCLQNKPCRDRFSVYKGVGVRDWVCYLSRGPLPFLVVPPTISSSCQCMYFLDRPWQPPLRARATLKGWHKTIRRKKHQKLSLNSTLLEKHMNGCTIQFLPLLSSYWVQWGGNRDQQGSDRVYPCSHVQCLPFPACSQSFPRGSLTPQETA